MGFIDLLLDGFIAFYLVLGSTSLGYMFLRLGWPRIRILDKQYRAGWSLILGVIFTSIIVVSSLIFSITPFLSFNFKEFLFLNLSVTFFIAVVVLTIKRKILVPRKATVTVPSELLRAKVAAAKAMTHIELSESLKEGVISVKPLEEQKIAALRKKLEEGKELGAMKASVQVESRLPPLEKMSEQKHEQKEEKIERGEATHPLVAKLFGKKQLEKPEEKLMAETGRAKPSIEEKIGQAKQREGEAKEKRLAELQNLLEQQRDKAREEEGKPSKPSWSFTSRPKQGGFEARKTEAGKKALGEQLKKTEALKKPAAQKPLKETIQFTPLPPEERKIEAVRAPPKLQQEQVPSVPKTAIPEKQGKKVEGKLRELDKTGKKQIQQRPEDSGEDVLDRFLREKGAQLRVLKKKKTKGEESG